MTVAFTDPVHSEWTLLRKVEEGNYQSPYGSEGTSTAWALFTCRNPQNKDDEAVIRIHMQVPISGTEFESSEKRALQAKKNLDSIAEGEFGALTRLASIGSKICTYHSWKETGDTAR
jgi:hypothetical protein